MRRSWTDDMVESELVDICQSIGHMPSNSELGRMSRTDLANQIARRGGFFKWSERVGYDRTFSCTDMGRSGERIVASIVNLMGHKAEQRKAVKSPYDLLVDGLVRVDVKTANQVNYVGFPAWYYRIGKHVQSDLVILFQADTLIAHVLPWFIVNTTNITISPTSKKYDAYKNAWNLLDAMVESRTREQKTLKALSN